MVVPSLHPYHSSQIMSLSSTICIALSLSSSALNTVADPTFVPSIFSSKSEGAKETREIPKALLNSFDLKGLSPAVMTYSAFY